LGYVTCGGLGARVRWWEYDHSAVINGDDYSVDTYNIDFEVFRRVCLGSCTTFEFSAGLRYNDFEQVSVRDGNQSFDGVGGMIAVEGRTNVFGCLGVYGRLREAILMEDWNNGAFGLRMDTSRPVTEVALGLDYCTRNLTLRGGWEWQNWGNYASDQFDIQQNTEDAGFGGFVFGAKLEY
jgi:hypothetical protein